MKFLESFFVFENLQQAKSILVKNGTDDKNSDFLKIKNLLSNHVGYVGWFVKMFFYDHVPFDDLKDFYQDTIISRPEVIQDLPKNLIQYEEWEELIDDVIKSSNRIGVKRIVNELPVLQKSFLDLNNTTQVNLLLKLYKSKDNQNLLKKISRYKTKKDLLDAIKLFTSDKRSIGYTNIKSLIEKSGSKIIYDSFIDNLIICEVNFVQLKKLASDTSWCILRDHMFNSYADGIDKQYIAFLTDKTDNESKIGITYGFKYKTSHLVNDQHISEIKLKSLLEKRGFDLGDLKISVNNIDMSNVSVKKLMDNGIPSQIIIKNKRKYKKEDLGYLPDNDIEKYGLKDLLEIGKNDLPSENTFEFIQKNLHRLSSSFSIGLWQLIKMDPSPSNLDLLNDQKILSEDAQEFYDFISSNKGSILKNMKDKLPKKDRYSLEELIYILKYDSSLKSMLMKDIIDYIPKSTFEIDDSGFENLINFFDLNNIEYSKEEINDLISKLYFGKYSNIFQIWIEICDVLPIMDEYLLKMIKKVIDHPKMNQNEISKLIDLSPLEIKILEEKFPDLKSKEFIDEKLAWKNMKEVLPSPVYGEGGGVARKETIAYQRSMGRTHVLITAKEIVDDFFDKLKRIQWPGGSSHGIDVLPTMYMIISLVKCNRLSDISKLNVRWSPELIGKIIRVALKTFTYNRNPYIQPSFDLTEVEVEKFFEYLLSNIKDKIEYSMMNIIIRDKELMRHECFSLVYYLYDWGFDKYVDMVRKTKSNLKEKWVKKDGVDWVEREKFRIEYFRHIFDYLKSKDMKKGIKDLYEMISDWEIPTKTEQNYNKYFISNYLKVSSWGSVS